MSGIFIQIASYRDPQLVPTVRDCLRMARHPEELRFCIAWQHGPEETLPDWMTRDPRIQILDIPAAESRGACWARNLIQQQYRGEAYTLAIDSHHRFVHHWDELLLGMFAQLRAQGVAKPLLTAYAPSFDPEDDPARRALAPWRLVFHRFTLEGPYLIAPSVIWDWERLTAPLPSAFLSAHFLFTSGRFCVEVPHDPSLYFVGEEMNLAARAYTHGYDLFNPHRIVLWHEYTRKGRRKHWDDHAAWHERDARSFRHTRILFGMEKGRIETEYGFGTERSLEDYARFAGICFRDRAAHPQTLQGGSPPNQTPGVAKLPEPPTSAPLTVILRAHNDGPNIHRAIREARETAGADLPIVIIDDASARAVAVEDPNAFVHRNLFPLGVGRSYDLGADLARTPYLLFTGARVRFAPGWHEATLAQIAGREHTLHAVPGDSATDDEEVLPFLSSDTFLAPRKFYRQLRGAKELLRGPGETPYFGVKAWLAGGDIRRLHSGGIHTTAAGAVWQRRERASWIHDRLYTADVLFDGAFAARLRERHQADEGFQEASELLERNRLLSEETRAFHRQLFVRDRDWYFDKFKIDLFADGCRNET